MSVIEQIVRITTDGEETKAEVVGEVVRCRDCTEYQQWNKTKICMRLGSYWGDTKPDDFCSYGERKDGDGDGNEN